MRTLDAFVANTPAACEHCKGKIYYVERGKYLCKTCGHVTLDDFAKIKEFLDEKGEVLAQMWAEKIGVDSQSIEYLFHRALKEIPEEESSVAQCERCGCSIPSGRFCTVCTRELAGGIRSVLFQENRGRRF